MFRKARRLHFVGVGGSGMSGIAEVLLNLRYRVSGSDLVSSTATRRLKRLGAEIHRGHRAEQVHGADAVVVSSAVVADNPEVVEARRLKIPLIPRAEMLAELMRMKVGVAVAGAHGKTTTTAMVAEVLTHGKLDPTVVIGGRVGKLRSGAKLGHGEILIAEADESDGSFLRMNPTIAVVTNIDREHLDHYGEMQSLCAAFRRFVCRVPFYGAAIVCIDEPHARSIVADFDRKLITYGLDPGADVHAREIAVEGLCSSFVAHGREGELGPVRIHAPGRHMVANALAAIAVGLELDVPFRTIAAALAAFRGVDRRTQLRGEVRGARLIDDYGHHPTEIEATLAAVRDGFGGRILVVFQPHRYSRSRALLDEFGRAFALAELVFVTDIYAAGEPRIPGLDGAAVADSLRRHGHPAVVYEPRLEQVVPRLLPQIRPGDVVLTLGAGDVWKVGEALLRAAARGGGGVSGERRRRSA